MPPSEKTPLECVMKVDTEQAMLERGAEQLAHEDAECEKLMGKLDADKAEMRPHGPFMDWVSHLPCRTRS